MSDFSGNEELLQDFLQEASELLSDVDNKLVDLEKNPADRALLNDVFRGFHTIKGGAGFLAATALVELCHRTENLFDKLRVGELQLDPVLMDVIMAATGEVRQMFAALSHANQPAPAPLHILAALDKVLAGEALQAQDTAGGAATAAGATPDAQTIPQLNGKPDWGYLMNVLTGDGNPQPQSAVAAHETDAATDGTDTAAKARRDVPADAARAGNTMQMAVAAGKETTIRVDTERLDNVLTLSGEIGLIKNRLTRLRSDLLGGRNDGETLRALDEAVGQLDLLVSSLQNAVMKTRMQPIGRLFSKYPRLARDLARQLGKEVELVLVGEETEIDKTMLEDLNDPLIHLVRNAVDHGVEGPEERVQSGKPAKCTVQLSARQEGDHVVIEIVDDGRGMRPDIIRAKAVEKGVISPQEANTLDEKASINLIFMPGFSTKTEVSSVSGRGVGMDVVKTNIHRLNGEIDVLSEPGKGSRFTISLPLTMAILPVLVVRLGEQPFALPLSLVREILPMIPGELQHVTGKATMVVRGEVLPVIPLATLLGWPHQGANAGGVLLEFAGVKFILAIDSFAGRDDVVIKSLEGFKPRGVAGVTLSSDGQIVLILDLKELLDDTGWTSGGIGQAQARAWLNSMDAAAH